MEFPASIPVNIVVSTTIRANQSPLILRALSAVADEREAAADMERREREEQQRAMIRQFRDLLAPLGIFYDVARATELISNIETFSDDPLTIKTENIYFSYYWNPDEARGEIQIGLDSSETRHIQWSTIPVLSILDLGYALEQIISGEFTYTRFAHAHDTQGKW